MVGKPAAGVQAGTLSKRDQKLTGVMEEPLIGQVPRKSQSLHVILAAKTGKPRL